MWHTFSRVFACILPMPRGKGGDRVLDLQHQSKLVEAIGYFAGHTRYCGYIKLFKLLYWLDYHHFRETGQTVTGLTYQAYPRGPLPETLYHELQSGHGSVADQFTITAQKTTWTEPVQALRTIDDDDESYSKRLQERPSVKHVPACFKPKRPYKHLYLTRREQRIANHLAEIFHDCTADQISDVSHARNGPWQQALKEKGDKATIDFLGKLFPMTKGEYLSDEELRSKAEEFEAEIKNWA